MIQGDSSSITLSATVLVWIGGLLIALVGGIGTICAHVLLAIHKDVRDMRKDIADNEKAMAMKEVEVEARMRVLERHDQRNSDEERQLMSSALKIIADKQ